jgi:hypothetical protein
LAVAATDDLSRAFAVSIDHYGRNTAGELAWESTEMAVGSEVQPSAYRQLPTD